MTGRSHRTAVPARLWVVAGVVLFLSGLAFALIGGHREGERAVIDWPRRPTDLEIYRNGAQLWMDGLPLYDGRVPPTSFGVSAPFTYPPVSAALLSPLAAMPLPLATLAVAAVSILALCFIVWVLLGRISVRPSLAVIAMVLGLAVWFEPIRTTLLLGQINIVLAAAVVADLLWLRRDGTERRTRGLLIGAGAAVKLVPAVFVVYFLIKRDLRGLVNSAMGFAVLTGAGWLLAPDDSRRYWTHTVFSPDRIGAPAYVYNQGIQGFIARLGLDDSDLTRAWAVVSLLALVAIVALAVRLYRRGEAVLCVVVVASIDYLITPASWNHHWILASALVGLLAVSAYRSRDRVLGSVAAVGLLVQLPGASAILPQRKNAELDWNLVEAAYGNGYLFWMIAVGVVLWWRDPILERGALPLPDEPETAVDGAKSVR